ncbi:hypothetical protein APHAL10511_004111 [Amanita phalloides]|nr:hypothetical protein APHAL10511_004111 [Amanita phalloides]
MIETLQKARDEQKLDGAQLLEYWHGLMKSTKRDGREVFFTEVVKKANTMKAKMGTFENSPIRKDGNVVPSNFDLENKSLEFYKRDAKKATKKLMKFLSRVLRKKQISVMYFDEAQDLDMQFCVFLRIVQHQLPSTKMWYAFMGTKSSVSYYGPAREDLHSLRLKSELAILPKPYFDLGFDQQTIDMAWCKKPVSVSMGDMQTIKFISQYGRPLWSALRDLPAGEVVALASLKLRNAVAFRATDKDHVFAVLSQRLCLEPVIAASEAVELADRSVAYHMRLLSGFTANYDRSYTHSPSEPILVMGTIDILYNTPDSNRLRDVLKTLSRDLCGAGLVDKGVLGELGARTLLLIARDFAAPFANPPGRNLLIPVPLLKFLHTLFGKDNFTEYVEPKLGKAFSKAHVNFTHWISTRDSIPKTPNENKDNKLLANLWARGAALQCCFSQESIDFIIPLYDGPINPDSEFDPSRLSAVIGQVKNKVAGDKKAELAIRPIGLLRNRLQPLPYLAILMELGNESEHQATGSKNKKAELAIRPIGLLRNRLQPLPYLAILMELGNESEHQATGSKINCEASEPPTEKAQKKHLEGLQKEARFAVDSCNRHLISVRGISPDVYGILRDARITQEFATLLSILMPLPVDDSSTIKHLRPLERLSESDHTDWMAEYDVSNKDGDGKGNKRNDEVSNNDGDRKGRGRNDEVSNKDSDRKGKKRKTKEN